MSEVGPEPTGVEETVVGIEEQMVAEASGSGSGSERVAIDSEAAELLLNFGTSPDKISSADSDDALALEKIVVEETSAATIYPYTPPDDQRPPQPSTSTDQLINNPLTDEPRQLPPMRTSPEALPKAKLKRKRQPVAGPSRLSSLDTPIDRPAHWLGEDNTIIRCICGFAEDDGFTIQCEGCGAWEHGQCFGYLDAASAPDTFFCELCIPRPVEAVTARHRQLEQKYQYDIHRQKVAVANGDSASLVAAATATARPPIKPKRNSVMEVDGDERDFNVPMGPPPTKPKRKQPGPKPRSAKSTMMNSSIAGPSFKEPPRPVTVEESEYFAYKPWELEFTPTRDNIVRGKVARQLMANLYREWVDAEEEEMAALRRPLHIPSGLPSPTETGVLRLTPDHLFPPPDYSILAAPIPPTFLTGPDLVSLSSPCSVRPITDVPSFLPPGYAEVSSTDVYARPALFGVFVDDFIPATTFIGEYRGEVLDCETYRRDPINQYSGLGMPKPHVHAIGPPVNLMIDARGYGCELRFIRSGCHPNSVLRPLLWRQTEADAPKLRFGIFASRDLEKGEEILLGWEWDDQHIVHSLRSISTASRNRAVQSKFDTVLSHILGSFSSCACPKHSLESCALVQMKGELVGRRGDLGDLVGAVRGWRRREMDREEARRWKLSGIGAGVEGGYGRSPEVEMTRSQEDELGRSPGIGRRRSDEVESMRSKSRSRSKTPEVEEVEMDVDEEGIALQGERSDVGAAKEEDMDIDKEADQAAVVAETLGDAEMGMEMDIEEDDTDESESTVSPAKPPSPRLTTPAQVPPHVPDNDNDTNTGPPSSSLSPVLSPPPPVSSPPISETAVRSPPDEDVEGDGNHSDATTITIPKTHFSDSELEPEPEAGPSRLPITKSTSIIAKKGRQRISPESSASASTSSPQDIKRITPLAPVKLRKVKVEKAKPPTRRPRKHRIVSSPISDNDEEEEVPRKGRGGKNRAAAVGLPEGEPTLPSEGARLVGEAGSLKREPMPPKELSPLRESTPPLPPREPTPPPKEPTPPPKEPSPPPEPPKKVSLSEYLKNHKIRKESAPIQTPSTDFNTSADDLTPVKQEDGAGSRLNLFEHLPTSRTISTPSYVPRQEYFPPQPQPQPVQNPLSIPSQPLPPIQTSQPAYQPRSTSVSYSGETLSGPSKIPWSLPPDVSRLSIRPPRPADALFASPSERAFVSPSERPIQTPSSAYVPRPTPTQLPPPPPTPQYPQTQPSPTPATLTLPSPSPSQVPSPLPNREQPPHISPTTPFTPLVSAGSGSGSGSGERKPPTGPKIPPTGPRGFAPSSPSLRGSLPVPGGRGGFMRGGGFGGIGRGAAAGAGGSVGERSGDYGGARGGWRGRGFGRGRGRGS